MIQSVPREMTNHRKIQRILVVDDSEPILVLIQKILQTHGFDQTDLAGDSSSALSLASQFNYTCILIDFQLAESNGITLGSQLRSHGFSGKMILMTAEKNPSSSLADLHTIFDSILPKPFGPNQLINCISE